MSVVLLLSGLVVKPTLIVAAALIVARCLRRQTLLFVVWLLVALMLIARRLLAEVSVRRIVLQGWKATPSLTECYTSIRHGFHTQQSNSHQTLADKPRADDFLSRWGGRGMFHCNINSRISKRVHAALMLFLFHSEARDRVPANTGSFSASDGHWSLKDDKADYAD